jgi:hypothetical protein
LFGIFLVASFRAELGVELLPLLVGHPLGSAPKRMTFLYPSKLILP